MNRAKAVSFVALLLASGLVLQAKQRVSSPPRQAAAKIMGVVLDPQDSSVSGAPVRVASTKFARKLTCGNEGDFEVELPAGVYVITVEAPSFRRFKSSPLRVKSDVMEMINVHIEPGGITYEAMMPWHVLDESVPTKLIERLSHPKR